MRPILGVTGVVACALLLAFRLSEPRSAARPPRGSGNPLASLVRDGLDAAPLMGRVEQRLPAGGYTYLAVRTGDAQLRWAVTMGQGAPAGERVSVRSLGHSASFHSRRLGRSFPNLVFGIVSRLD